MAPPLRGQRRPCHGHRRAPACDALLTMFLHFLGTREFTRLKLAQARGDENIRMIGSPVAQKAQQLEAEVHRLDARSLQPGDLIKDVTKPVVLTHLAEDWPGSLDWTTDYLSEHHGDVRVPILTLPDEIFDKDAISPEMGNSLYADHYRNSYVPQVRPPREAHLSDWVRYGYHDYLFTFDDTVSKRLAADAIGGRSNLPSIFSADNLTQFTFGMGPPGDGVMFHAHTAAWNALLYGEKEWLFFAPDRFVGDVYENLAMVSATEIMKAVDAMNASHGMLRCRQKPGEVVWIPDGWWHATYSHTPTGCVGGQRHKEKLPSDYWQYNLQLWPESGLFMNGLARQLGNVSLFEAALKKEPYNFNFVMECLVLLRDEGQYGKSVQAAEKFRSDMERMWRNGLLGRAEFAAQLAELAGFLYSAVEHALAADAKDEIMPMSTTTNRFVEEALSLDADCPLAKAIADRIKRQSEVGMKQMGNDPSQLLEMLKMKGSLSEARLKQIEEDPSQLMEMLKLAESQLS